MLTTRHLAIIRAALQFFDEEISPHGAGGAFPYFEEPLEEHLQTEEFAQLRELLRSVELKYVRSDQTGTRILSHKLLTSEEVQQRQSADPSRIATVILTAVD
ncbi:hypothetical protein [Planctomicrobium sp. SH527]|uniref:hypothetical protein n=1 Tax=Planctomicrobium sp. SH527 TaxID=3448123 RepID=UPI003F5BAFB7